MLPLAGRRIVLTRPAGQNEALAARIAALGGEAILYPVMQIRDVDDPEPLARATAELDRYDLAVFISPNAVERALDYILARRAWPEGLTAATVGQGSATALRERGIARVIAPEARFDSEHLLALLPERMDGQRVVIFRGQDGRPLLGDTLRQRGAEVHYVPCYVRERPPGGDEALGGAPVDAFVVTSSEGLRNLFEMLGPAGRRSLREARVVVTHARIAEQARALGLERVSLTSPGDAGILSALTGFWDKVEGGSD